jgi:hypothetical protein
MAHVPRYVILDSNIICWTLCCVDNKYNKYYPHNEEFPCFAIFPDLYFHN